MRALFANCTQGPVMSRVSHSSQKRCAFLLPPRHPVLLKPVAGQNFSSSPVSKLPSSGPCCSGSICCGCPILAPGMERLCSCSSAGGIWGRPLGSQPWRHPLILFIKNYRDLNLRPERAFKFQNPILRQFLREFKLKNTKRGDEKTQMKLSRTNWLMFFVRHVLWITTKNLGLIIGD